MGRLTDRVIISSVMNDTTNNTDGVPKKNTNSRHVLSRSNLASTLVESYLMEKA